MLLRRDVKKLRKAGFTDWEIGTLNENLRQRPQVLDLTTIVWQKVLRRRTALIDKWVKSGKSLEQFNKKIMSYYTSTRKASIWDWVKIEYRPSRKVKDFTAALAKRAATARKKAGGRLGRGLGLKGVNA